MFLAKAVAATLITFVIIPILLGTLAATSSAARACTSLRVWVVGTSKSDIAATSVPVDSLADAGISDDMFMPNGVQSSLDRLRGQ